MTDNTVDEINDLAKLASVRARKAVDRVTQLLDSDDDNGIACVMMCVASDMIMGAAYHIYQSEEDIGVPEAMGRVLEALFGMLDEQDTLAAIKTIKSLEEKLRSNK